jgi:ABC-type multidrug transport system fused ATPase/permease subunit
VFLKSLRIFDANEKVLFFIFFLLLVISSILELLGIGLIIPVLNSLLSVNGNESSNSVINFFNKFVLFFYSDIENNKYFSIYLLLSIFLIKIFYLLFLYILQYFFTIKIAKTIFLKTYRAIIYQSYNFYINRKRSVSQLITAVNYDCDVYANSYMTSLVLLISDSILLIFIFIFLFLVNFKIALFIFTFSALIFITMKLLTKKKIKQISIFREKIESLSVKHLQDTFFGIREIKLSFKENSFIQIFKSFFYKKIKLSAFMVIFNQLPRIWIELAAILLIFIFIYNLNSHTEINNQNELVNIMVLYTFAFIRVAPSLNRIIVHSNNLKYTMPHVKKVLEYLNFKNRKESYELKKSMTRNFEFNCLSLQNIHFKYPNSDQLILKNLNLRIKKGDIVGLIGKSGEGKSTLVDIICGFLLPIKGKITVNNKMLSNNNDLWKRKVGYVSQNSYLFNDTIVKNITLDFSKNNNTDSEIKNVKKAIYISQLDKLISKLPDGLTTKIGEFGNNLSGGQKQRIAIARILYREPELIILDEATAALDKITEKKLIQSLIENNPKKTTIVIISHKKSSLTLCNKIYKICGKKIKRISNKYI